MTPLNSEDSFCFKMLLGVCGPEDQTWSLAHARQMLYHRPQSFLPSSLFLWVFLVGVVVQGQDLCVALAGLKLAVLMLRPES